MFSGKTTELIRRINMTKYLKFGSNNILIITHKLDDRYTTHGGLCSHDNEMMRSTFACDTLMPILNTREYEQCDYIFIDEAQFFEDLVPFIKRSVDYNKKRVTVCGLDGDFERNPFGSILEIIPMCDSITKKKSLCVQCNDGKEALFTKILENIPRTYSSSNPNILIGSSNMYKPVCRNHYLCTNPSVERITK
jgi:thymidine kinase